MKMVPSPVVLATFTLGRLKVWNFSAFSRRSRLPPALLPICLAINISEQNFEPGIVAMIDRLARGVENHRFPHKTPVLRPALSLSNGYPEEPGCALHAPWFRLFLDIPFNQLIVVSLQLNTFLSRVVEGWAL